MGVMSWNGCVVGVVMADIIDDVSYMSLAVGIRRL